MCLSLTIQYDANGSVSVKRRKLCTPLLWEMKKAQPIELCLWIFEMETYLSRLMTLFAKSISSSLAGDSGKTSS